MAATQKIVRITESDSIKCSQSEDKLDNLISFKLNAADDSLDLNWAPMGLEIYCKNSKQNEAVCTALGIVLNGVQLLNKQHKDRANGYIVYSDITYTSPNKVEQSASAFKQINWVAMESCMPQNKDEALSLLNTDLDCHPNEYYIPKMRELINFVQGTANKQMGLAQWWD